MSHAACGAFHRQLFEGLVPERCEERAPAGWLAGFECEVGRVVERLQERDDVGAVLCAPRSELETDEPIESDDGRGGGARGELVRLWPGRLTGGVAKADRR